MQFYMLIITHCWFTFVSIFSAIPYLGYLPQDMIGMSVFKFYHTDDMPHLKDIYELGKMNFQHSLFFYAFIDSTVYEWCRMCHDVREIIIIINWKEFFYLSIKLIYFLNCSFYTNSILFLEDYELIMIINYCYFSNDVS